MTARPTTTPGVALAALRALRGQLPLLLALYGVNLAFTALTWALGSRALSVVLEGRPALDLLGWAALLRAHPGLPLQLGLAAAGLGLGYLLVSTFLAGATLARLGGAAALRGGRAHLWGLLRLRLLCWALLAALGLGLTFTAPDLYRQSLWLDDDRAPALLQAGLALLFALPAAVVALALHYGQALLVLRPRRGPVRAALDAFALLHRRPLRCLALWLAAWAAWAAVTLAFGAAPVTAPLLAQGAALLRVAVHLWSYAAARGVALAEEG